MPTGSVGFLGASKISDSCLPFSFNIGSNFVSLTLDASLSFGIVFTSSTALSVSLSTLSPAITKINDAKLY
jgi:hypothetical protein